MACHARCRSTPATARRCASCCGKPAAIVSFLEGAGRAGSRSAHCAALGRGVGGAASGLLPISPLPRANALSVAGWQSPVRGLPRQGRRGRARPRAPRSRGTSTTSPELAARPAGRRHPCRPVPRQRVLRRRAGHRHHRLLFRLQRSAGLRRRDLPERLVLRDRRLAST